MGNNNGNGLPLAGALPIVPACADLVFLASIFGAAAQSGVLQRAALQARSLAEKRRAGIPLQATLARFEKLLADPAFWAMYGELVTLISTLPRAEAVAGKYLGANLFQLALPDITADQVNELLRTWSAAKPADPPGGGSGDGGGL